VKALRSIFLLGLGLALAYLAGWGMPGSELAAPAAVAGFGSAALALA
jgi:hypothetical protein